MNNAIEIRNLYKTYPGFSLNNISFTVPEGICCGFVGPNGAGKTTTLRTLTGMAAPDSGQIRLLDQPVSSYSVREEMGILFDQPYFQEEWTPRDIERGLRPFYKSWDSGRYRSLLARFELDPRRKFKKFSRGMKMKLGLAVCLARETRLLLLDEPTGGLDPAARDEVLDLLREYMIPENRTILFSTHITSDLERIADQIVYISHGSISYCGSREELTSSYCMVRGYRLPRAKQHDAIGLRLTDSGYECLMELSRIGGLPVDAVIEPATIEDVVVYCERKDRQPTPSPERSADND